MNEELMNEEFRQQLLERTKIDDEDYIALENYMEKASTLFSKDINKTIEFMLKDCTADEFSSVSEFFDKIVEKTHSKEFIDCLYKVANKYPDETKKYNILSFIDDAKEMM